jgi:hypothetical protein
MTPIPTNFTALDPSNNFIGKKAPRPRLRLAMQQEAGLLCICPIDLDHQGIYPCQYLETGQETPALTTSARAARP